jgi:glutamate N-acetyltransferase/amino-acid N-acetyltransferase
MSILAARGFRAAGAAIGIKGAGRLDAALIAADEAVPAAAVFTRNKACAAPVLRSRAHLAATGGSVRAVLLTSGNANAATGADGLAAVDALCARLADELGCPVDEVLVCQTGLIGIPFPIDDALAGFASLLEGLSSLPEAGQKAAEAILTTDTFAKQVVVEGEGFVVGGMAKGAAMLAPDMATMLAVLTTDAAVTPELLSGALAEAVGPSFNSLLVDGATSTNDTVIVLSSGTAGVVDLTAFTEALSTACLKLAEDMAYDAEGATKAVRITVSGAADDTEAHKAARKVANSLLVKCSLNGEDPYWGRVLSEVGTADIEMDPEHCSIAYGGIVVSAGGVAIAHDEDAVAAHMAERWLSIEIDLGLGEGRGAVLTTDLGHGYIDENRTTS